MKSILRFAMLALVLVIVAMISALMAMRFAIHGQEVTIPTLVGLSPLEAERAVSGLGLRMTIERKYYSPQIPEGKIMSQLPMPGTKVRRGWEVRVAQSLGPMRVTIPDVVGQSEHAADLNIRRRGLELASTSQVETQGIPPDQVLAQSPPPNATQVLAPKISLLVSAPPSEQAFVMPSFIGQPLGTVSQTLQDNGFRLGNVSVAVPTAPPVESVPNAVNGNPSPPPSIQPEAPPEQPGPASIIVSQSPPPGQKVVAGTAVSVEVR